MTEAVQAGVERGRGPGLPLERRQLPGEPGLLAGERDRPGRVRGFEAGDIPARFLRRGRSGRCVRGRSSPAHGESRQQGVGTGGAARGPLSAAGPGGCGDLAGTARVVRGCAGGRRGREHRQRDGGRSASLDRRNPVALPPGHLGGGPGRGSRRSRVRAGGIPPRRDHRRDPHPERPAHRAAGRQPPRARPRARPRRLRGVDDRGHPPDEAAEHQRGAGGPLPERAALVRAHRPVRPLRGGRGQHRVARDGVRAGRYAGGAAGLAGRAHGPYGADGRAGQEPRVDHHLVAGQRGGGRGELRLDGGVDPGARPEPADPVRAVRRAGQHRHRGADVRTAVLAGAVRAVWGGQAVPAGGVRARDGEQRGEPGRLLGGDRFAPAIAGRVHLGLGGPGDAGDGRGGGGGTGRTGGTSGRPECATTGTSW